MSFGAQLRSSGLREQMLAPRFLWTQGLSWCHASKLDGFRKLSRFALPTCYHTCYMFGTSAVSFRDFAGWRKVLQSHRLYRAHGNQEREREREWRGTFADLRQRYTDSIVRVSY